MSDLQHQVYEQAKSSSTWRYKLGFSCEKCEMRWYTTSVTNANFQSFDLLFDLLIDRLISKREFEHQIKSNDEAKTNTDEFLESPITQQMPPRCNCAQLLDLAESDEPVTTTMTATNTNPNSIVTDASVDDFKHNNVETSTSSI